MHNNFFSKTKNERIIVSLKYVKKSGTHLTKISLKRRVSSHKIQFLFTFDKYKIGGRLK